MKAFILLAVFAVILWATAQAEANPFLICDPQTGVTQYRVTFDGGGEQLSPAEADGSAKHDIGNLTEGAHTGTIQAGAQYTLDGEPQPVWVWSNAVPFDLTVPAMPAVVGIGLSP